MTDSYTYVSMFTVVFEILYYLLAIYMHRSDYFVDNKL